MSIGLVSCGEENTVSDSKVNDSIVSLPIKIEPLPSNCSYVGDPLAVFTNVTVEAGLCYKTSVTDLDTQTSRLSGGIAVSDYNGDGRLDMYVTHGRNSPGKLFQQNSYNQFDNVTQASGISTESIDRGAIFVDLNHDGFLDLISVLDVFPFINMFVNNGNGTFTDNTNSIGIKLTKPAFSIAAGDYDLDGDLDLFFAHWLTKKVTILNESLWTNQGDATFIDNSYIVDIQPIIGTYLSPGNTEKEYSFTPIFADINNDRYPDMLLTGDFTSTQLLMNNNGITFDDLTSDVFTDSAGMGAAVADYDNDGDLDWFVSAIGDPLSDDLTNAAYSGNRLYQNNGGGFFTDVTDIAGVRQAYWGWGSCFADFNNDGHLDLFIVNGYDGLTLRDAERKLYAVFNDNPAVLYVNNGDNTFTERATELGVIHTKMGRGLVCYDYDRDGDQDIVIANNGEAPTLFRNNSFSHGHNFLNIKLQGAPGNNQGVGARVYLSIDGRTQMIELQSGNQYLSQNPVEAHFGLGKATKIDSLKVIWPGLEKVVTELINIKVNQFLLIEHPYN